MSSNEPFLKVPNSLIDNEVLTPTEKCLYIVLTRLRTAKRGCVPSYTYIKRKLKIKDNRTVLRALDRLQFFGYITWKNRGQNKSNKYYFRDEPEFQSILQDNLKLRKIMSLKQQQIKQQRIRDKFVNKVGIKLVNN
tara:strand:+ start:229 stop:636 length:408 start_codon:yes stop_codon:yes gene_type:complete